MYTVPIFRGGGPFSPVNPTFSGIVTVNGDLNASGQLTTNGGLVLNNNSGVTVPAGSIAPFDGDFDFTNATINNPTFTGVAISTDLFIADSGVETPYVQLDATATVPSTTSIWLDQADTARPSWGNSGQLALLSDITTPSFNDVTLTGTTNANGPFNANAGLSTTTLNASGALTSSSTVTATGFVATPVVSNPGGATTIWVNSAAATRPTYGTTGQLALLSDIPSFSNPTFTGTVTANDITASGLITANGGLSTTDIDADSLSLNAQASNPGGADTIWLDSAAPTRPKFGATQLALLTDISNVLANPTFTGTATSSGPFVAQVGITSNFLTLSPASAANPGTASTIWLNSATPTRPSFGSAGQLALLSDIVAPSYNNVTLTGTTTVSGPINISGLTTASGGVNTTTVTASGLVTANAGVATTTVTASGLVSANGGLSTTTVTASGLVSANGGLSTTVATANALTLSAVAANPGGSSTIWLDSAALTRPKFGSTQLALLSDIVAPSYNNVTLTGTTTVSGPINISGLTTASGGLNTSTITASGLVTANAGVTTTTVTASSLISANGGLTTTVATANALTFTAVAANPGGATSLWLDSAALTRPKFGATQLALLTDIPSFANPTFTGTVTAQAITASGLITANGGLTGTTVTASGVITANGGLTGTTVTASGVITANGGLTTTVATANALTLNALAANPGGATTIWLDSTATTRPKFGSTQLALLSDIVAPSFNNVTLTGTTTVSGPINISGLTSANGGLTSTTVTASGLVSANAGLTTTVATATALTFTAVAANPGGATSLWLDSTALTRPKFGATQLALLSDVPSFNNPTFTGTVTAQAITASGLITANGGLTATTVTASGLVSANGGLTTTVATANALTLAAQAANPGGTATVWLDSAALTRPKFGTTQLALLSDIPSFANPTFTGTVTAQAITASGLITANGGLTGTTITASGLVTANGGITTTAVTASGLVSANGGLTTTVATANALTLNALAANPGGATTIWLDSTATTRPKFGSTQLALLSDIVAPSFNNVTLTGTTTVSGPINISGLASANGGLATTTITASGLVSANAGLTTTVATATALTFTAVAANPGGATSLWLDSAALTRPKFGSTQVALLTDIPSFNNPTFTGTVTAAAITASGLITANGGISATTITASGLVTANAGVTTTTVTASGLVSANGGLTTTVATATALTLTAVAANPGGATTVWLDSAATTRPKFGTTQLALLTDIPSFNNPTFTGTVTAAAITASGLITANGGISATTVTASGLVTANAGLTTTVATANALTLTAVAANPGGATTVWLDSTALTRPKFGATQLALLTDIPSFNNPTFTGTVTAAAITASGLITANGGLTGTTVTASGLITANGGLTGTTITASGLVSANGGLSTTVATATALTLTAVAANPGGATTVWLDSAASTRPKFGTTQLALLTDIPSFNNPTFTGTVTAAAITASGLITANGGLSTTTVTASGLVSANAGLSTTVATLNGVTYNQVAANPGGATTMWVDTSGVPRFGASVGLVTNSLPSVVDAIPTYTSVSGGIANVTSTTAATLARPVNVSAGNIGTAATFSSTNTSCSVRIGTTNAGSNRGSLGLGRINLWEVGSDSNANNTDDFYLFSATLGAQVMKLDATDGVLQAPRGVRVVPTTATNGLITVGPAIASAQLGTMVMQSTPTLAGFATYNFNGYFNGAEVRINTTKSRWRMGVDQRSTTDLLFFDNYNGTTTASVMSCNLVSGVLSTVAFGPGVSSNRYDITSAAANPGGANTLWLNSAATTRPSFAAAGQLALLSDVPTVTNSTTTISPNTFPWAAAANFTLTLTKSNGWVDGYLTTANLFATGTQANPFVFNGAIPAAFLPAGDDNYRDVIQVLNAGNYVPGSIVVTQAAGNIIIAPLSIAQAATGFFAVGGNVGIAVSSFRYRALTP